MRRVTETFGSEEGLPLSRAHGLQRNRQRVDATVRLGSSTTLVLYGICRWAVSVLLADACRGAMLMTASISQYTTVQF